MLPSLSLSLSLLGNRYILFFQLPVFPEILLMAFNRSMLRWMLGRAFPKNPEHQKAYLEPFRTRSEWITFFKPIFIFFQLCRKCLISKMLSRC